MARKTKEPATKIVDGKLFGYIRPGVYGYPSDKAEDEVAESIK